MPVEIKELVIRAVVNDGQSDANDDDAGQSSGGGADDNQVIVQECVRQVMQLLARNRER